MKALSRDDLTPFFVPDYLAKSIIDVDFKLLKKRGVKFIAFDADSTLVNWRGKALSQATRSYLQANRKLFTGWCIASNRINNDLLPLATSMDAQVVRATLFNRKPQRRYFDQVISHFGAQPYQIAMIGDKLFADMYGAKRAGLITVWVEHIGRDGLWDRLTQLRKRERRLMQAYSKQPWTIS